MTRNNPMKKTIPTDPAAAGRLNSPMPKYKGRIIPAGHEPLE